MSDGFLTRWARRKEAVKAAEQNVAQDAIPSPLRGGVGVGVVQDEAGAVPPAPPPPPPSSPQGGGEAPDLEALALNDVAASEAPADTDQHLLDLPSLDALTPDTDLTPFLRTGVPSALRNAALRRMWSLDPSIRDFVSEAREYAYDWNTPGGVPGMGPLLPGDDVKAMLGRLFRDPAEAKPEAGSPADAPEPEPADSLETGVAEAADEVPAPEPEPAQASIVSAEPPQLKVAEAPRPEPRLRRHGGAKPA